MMKPAPSCGITITTHNRKDDLVRTLGAVAALRPSPDEVIICVDGCDDGTGDWCSASHPEYKLIIHESARGSVASRNEMMGISTSDILLGLDDDSHPIELNAIERLRGLFLKNPRLAVASFPQRSDEFPDSLTATDFGPRRFLGSYANSGAAIRRTAFFEVGGYPGHFHHAYEEADFALRCLNAGWQVCFEPAITIRHYYSSVERNEQRTHHLHARNELWSVFMRCPAPQLFAVAAFRAARQFEYARDRGWSWVFREPAWWIDFLVGLPQSLRSRQPISWDVYADWIYLLREPIFSEEEWQRKFAVK